MTCLSWGPALAPCLVVDRLTSRERGKVGLWVDSKEGAFRNLKIVRAKKARGWLLALNGGANESRLKVAGYSESWVSATRMTD